MICLPCSVQITYYPGGVVYQTPTQPTYDYQQLLYQPDVEDLQSLRQYSHQQRENSLERDKARTEREIARAKVQFEVDCAEFNLREQEAIIKTNRLLDEDRNRSRQGHGAPTMLPDIPPHQIQRGLDDEILPGYDYHANIQE